MSYKEFIKGSLKSDPTLRQTNVTRKLAAERRELQQNLDIVNLDTSNIVVETSTSGLPYVLHSDHQTSLVSKAFTELMATLRIKHTVCSPRIHRSLGKIERLNRSINDQLRVFLNAEALKNWDLTLPLLEVINRSAQTPNRPFSPFSLAWV